MLHKSLHRWHLIRVITVVLLCCATVWVLLVRRSHLVLPTCDCSDDCVEWLKKRHGGVDTPFNDAPASPPSRDELVACLNAGDDAIVACAAMEWVDRRIPILDATFLRLESLADWRGRLAATIDFIRNRNPGHSVEPVLARLESDPSPELRVAAVDFLVRRAVERSQRTLLEWILRQIVSARYSDVQVMAMGVLARSLLEDSLLGFAHRTTEDVVSWAQNLLLTIQHVRWHQDKRAFAPGG